MADKSHCVPYHLVFECQEGYDVPLTALEKRHHRMRHRNEAKPSVHGARPTARRHAKAHLLARNHSWPRLGEEAEDTEGSSESAPEQAQAGEEPKADDLGPLASLASDEVSADWPPLRLSGMMNLGKVEISSTYVEPSDATSQSSLSMEPPAPGELAEATPKDTTFAGRLLSGAKPATGPQTWPSLKTMPRVLPRGLPPPSLEVGLREIGKVPVDAGVAEAASRCLQKLVSDHVAKSGEISFGQMVGLLKYAVELGNKRLLRPQAKGTSLSSEEQDENVELVFDSAPTNLEGQFDLRGKGWLRSHKASLSVKAQELVAEKRGQRLEQRREVLGELDGGYQLGQSWRVNDKRRSKQHGGHLRFRRSRIGWVEE